MAQRYGVGHMRWQGGNGTCRLFYVDNDDAVLNARITGLVEMLPQLGELRQLLIRLARK